MVSLIREAEDLKKLRAILEIQNSFANETFKIFLLLNCFCMKCYLNEYLTGYGLIGLRDHYKINEKATYDKWVKF